MFASKFGNFSIILNDDNFDTWAGLGEYQPVTFAINGTRIFKGRIDTVIRHYDKSKAGGYLTTVSGRDDGGALQDAIISAAYTDYVAGTYIGGSLQTSSPENILGNILAKYIAQKAANDPTITLDTVDFGSAAAGYSYALKLDRQSAWHSTELLCQTVEGKLAQTKTPVYLDFWVNESDQLNVTQTGEIVQRNQHRNLRRRLHQSSRNWTQDALPLKNDIWVYGDAKGGILPLDSDPYYLATIGDTMTSPPTSTRRTLLPIGSGKS